MNQDPLGFGHYNPTPLHVPTQPQSVAPAHKGPGGLAGFLINNLPSIAGGIGLVGGELLDPFGGGLVTGGAASAAGEALKRKLLGQSFSPKEMAIQAGETALLGGAGKAFGAARAGSKSLLGKGSSAAIKDASTAVKPSFRQGLATQGEQMQARGLGISGGAHVAGVPDLFPQDTSRMLSTLKKEKIPLGNANSAAEAVQNRLTKYGDQIDNVLQTSNKPLSAKAKQSVLTQYRTAIENLPGVDASVRKQAENLMTNYSKQVGDAVSQNKFIRGLDQHVISYIANPEAGSAAKQLAAKTFRGILRDNTNELVPGLKQANDAYHALTEIKPFLGKGMREVNQPSGGLIGRIASMGPVQKAEASLGRGVEKIAGVGKPTPTLAGASSVPGNEGLLSKALSQPKALAKLPLVPAAAPGSTIKSVGKQVIGRAVGNAAMGNESLPQQETGGAAPQDLTSALTQGQDNSQTSDIQSQYPLENALADATRDPKNADYYMKLYQFIQSSTQSNTPKLNSTQQQQANNAVSALQDLQTLSQMIQKDPNIAAKDILPTSLGHRLTGTTDYQAARANIADVIARLRSGAAINAHEEKLYLSLLPQAGDTPEAAQSKIQRLASLFQSFANPQPAATDLSTVLSQLGQ